MVRACIHYLGNWTGWALKIKTFLGPEIAMSEASANWDGPSNGFARIKIIKSKRHTINRPLPDSQLTQMTYTVLIVFEGGGGVPSTYIPRVPQRLPLVGIETAPPSHPQANVNPTPNQRGGGGGPRPPG